MSEFKNKWKPFIPFIINIQSKSEKVLVTNKDLLVPAREKGYAIGAFNVNNVESALAVSEAAIDERSPAIVAVTPSAIKYAGLSYLSKIVRLAADFSPVPMSLHLDHGEDYDTVSKCIAAGFTSVMIDGSHFKFEENITLTRRIVDLARPKGVSVEAELGRKIGVADVRQAIERGFTEVFGIELQRAALLESELVRAEEIASKSRDEAVFYSPHS
jgi:fructose-bisphosphate aldolase class II